MPSLACWSCGRQLYTVAPLQALFAEERRCPRCGAFLHEERRELQRRSVNRRTNPPDDPGPPAPTARRSDTATADNGSSDAGGERRVDQRRTGQRRGSGADRSSAATDAVRQRN